MSEEINTPSAEVLARRLQHSARLAAVGKLASSAAHELNQPLNVMRMAVFNLKRAIEKDTLDPESALAKLERIDQQINRAAQLVGGMRAFSPTVSALSTDVEVGESVGTALALMAKRFTAANVELHHQPCTVSLTLSAPPSALQELVTHLVDNALEAYGALPEHNPLLAEGSAPLPRQLFVQEALDGDAWSLTIEDNAGGIPAHCRSQVFLPFFTTHEDNSHAGLGLTVSQALVAALGGTLVLIDTGQGTRIEISLPVKQGITTAL